MGNNKIKGSGGESLACGILEADGYRILERNYRIRSGEIDIIALRDRTLHFIEVKTRAQSRYGTPALAVSGKKLQTMKKVAEYYIKCSDINWNYVSFDVFEVQTNFIVGCV